MLSARVGWPENRLVPSPSRSPGISTPRLAKVVGNQSRVVNIRSLSKAVSIGALMMVLKVVRTYSPLSTKKRESMLK